MLSFQTVSMQHLKLHQPTDWPYRQHTHTHTQTHTQTHTHEQTPPPTHPLSITLIQAWYETVCFVSLSVMSHCTTCECETHFPCLLHYLPKKDCIFKKRAFSATTLYQFLKCPIYFFYGKTYVPSFSILGLNTVPSLTVLREYNKQKRG